MCSKTLYCTALYQLFSLQVPSKDSRAEPLAILCYNDFIVHLNATENQLRIIKNTFQLFDRIVKRIFENLQKKKMLLLQIIFKLQLREE